MIALRMVLLVLIVGFMPLWLMLFSVWWTAR